MFLKIAYTIFLSLILTTFVAVGIAAFYKEPKPPTVTTTPYKYMPAEGTTESAKLQIDSEKNQKEWDLYQENRKIYSRNVSIIALAFSILFLALSLTVFNKLASISDGILLGSVFTLIYSIFRGFESQDDQFRFFVVLIGLLIALIVGYLKFVKVSKRKNIKK